ncbi:MAG: hypothetical protein GTO67_09790 [Gammaproteobacteria bacterium]|nr:hypothetical protein [Gammaproteobacteria bacterium]NIM74041.1 hypothetical protein [Gammaproteobacteria bacterium]NIN38923.1 hypothetical protein [Gammaproteobacteria bacterium]NIO25816.1 hypothetical protein [Gammaproteobacteria bacterium]NIO66447.1 hypothetical protein [Gammaproteobacteria bacterium]
MSATSAVVAGVVSGWIAGTFDDITLLIPTEDAGGRVDLDELAPSTSTDLALGMLHWQDTLWPVYRLDRELSPIEWQPSPSTVVLPVFADGQARGILCDQIRSFDHPVAVSLHAIPGCLRHRASPVIALGLYETLRIGMVVRGETLIRHLDSVIGGSHP